MGGIRWDERRKLLSEKAHEARERGREQDFLVLSSLAELSESPERTSAVQIETLLQKVEHLQQSPDHLAATVSQISRRLAELELRVHEDLE